MSNKSMKVECATCSKVMLVHEDLKDEPECHNCYITRLELLNKEAKDKVDAKIIRHGRGKTVQS